MIYVLPLRYGDIHCLFVMIHHLGSHTRCVLICTATDHIRLPFCYLYVPVYTPAVHTFLYGLPFPFLVHTVTFVPFTDFDYVCVWIYVYTHLHLPFPPRLRCCRYLLRFVVDYSFTLPLTLFTAHLRLPAFGYHIRLLIYVRCCCPAHLYTCDCILIRVW